MRSPAGFDLRSALLEELLAAETALGEASARAEGVHRCRVRLKRARALARVGRASAPGLAALFNQTAREGMAALARSRDAFALVETARRAAEKAGSKSASALRALAQALEGAARPAQPDLSAAGSLLRDLRALAQVWPEASPLQIEKGARDLAKRARAARVAGRASACADKRHRWRKREKDRLYAALILGDAWPRARRRKLATRLTEALGAERDARRLLEMLDAEAVSAGSARDDKLAERELRAQLARLTRKANRLSRRL